MNATTGNLPEIVARIGGAFEMVVRNVVHYTDEKFPLIREAQEALARVIEAHPEFNTEERVTLLIDARVFHGVPFGYEFDELLDEFGLDIVGFVLDYLYNIGEDTTVDPRLNWHGPKGLHAVCTLVEALRDEDIELNSPEVMDSIIWKLGGLAEATNMEIKEVIARLADVEDDSPLEDFEEDADDS
jgi:hypothetical protein